MKTEYYKIRLKMTYPPQKAFTLIEAITVLAIASVIMMASLKVYSNVKMSVEKINVKLEENVKPIEILQRISEDVDRLAAPGFDTTLSLQNKNSNGFNITQLIIENRFYGNSSKPETYERIIWQTAYDQILGSLVLFRAHNGLHLEDGLTDRTETGEIREGIERFVPVCEGVTYFDIQIPSGENFISQWSNEQLPRAIVVTISFAEPVEDEFGEFVIPEDEFLFRTIAIDRTRKISFEFKKKDLDMDEFESNDPNDMSLGPVDTEAEAEADAGESGGPGMEEETEEKDIRELPSRGD